MSGQAAAAALRPALHVASANESMVLRASVSKRSSSSATLRISVPNGSDSLLRKNRALFDAAAQCFATAPARR